jgi:phenolic acid decarboxylase
MTSCWHALLVGIFWTEPATGIHLNCNWQTNENEIEGVLFFLDFFSFSRLVSTWFILKFREY